MPAEAGGAACLNEARPTRERAMTASFARLVHEP
jgi:hypothetical protein